MSMTLAFPTKISLIKELACRAAQPLGLTVLEVKIGQQGRRPSLQVCIFRKGGPVSLSDCEHVSRQLDLLLDEEKSNGVAFDSSYVLEIVSPGIDRQLLSAQDFEAFAGELVRVKARENFGDLGPDFCGTLKGGDDQKITLLNAEPVVTAGKAAKKKAKGTTAKTAVLDNNSESVANTQETEVDLRKVFKVNLYADPWKSAAKQEDANV